MSKEELRSWLGTIIMIQALTIIFLLMWTARIYRGILQLGATP